jgi:hypothetical protein
VKSGTESFNCPDSENLCDLNHVNVGGTEINEVIAITKMEYEKNTAGTKTADLMLICDGCHISILRVCLGIVTGFTKYFYADFSGCDRRQTLCQGSTPGLSDTQS